MLMPPRLARLAAKGTRSKGCATRSMHISRPARISAAISQSVGPTIRGHRLPDGADHGKWVEGLLTWIVYDGPQGHSTLEIYKNYENALVKGGFEIGFTCKKKDCGRDFIEDLLDATGRMVGNGERWMPGSERHLGATNARSRHENRLPNGPD